MDEMQDSEIPSPLLAGRLEGINLPDLLWALGRRRSTGVLKVVSGGAGKTLYYQDGRIVFAASSDADDRLGELFLRRGMIGLDDLERALDSMHTGKRLGTLLVEQGSLTADQLVEGVLAQVEGIVLDLFAWENGDYRFDEGPLPTAEVITLSMNTGELLLRGIRGIRAFSRIRRSVGPPHRVYGLSPEWRLPLEGIGLSAGEEMLIDRLRRDDAAVEALCREVYLSNFEIYQTLWGLRVLGAIEERERPREVPADVTVEGSLSQVDFSELLVRLGRAGDTGVLQVTRGSSERTFHIAGGRCIFATSNDPDDGLVAYLLRRGVISLNDREETAKRLLSNKRVGTILRELGVIDERDLKEMVRQQLSEIVFDTFRWTDADYAFVPGNLPSVEDITLEADLDRLVAEGLRRVTSWSRVWRGCGGLEVTLELKPTYLSVLDAMSAGPEEWDVIAALKSPRTPREICRQSDLGDFRVCQILWAMRVLGAVEAVSAATLRARAAVEPVAASRRIPVEELDEVAATEGPIFTDGRPEPAVVADDTRVPIAPSATTEEEEDREIEVGFFEAEPAASRFEDESPEGVAVSDEDSGFTAEVMDPDEMLEAAHEAPVNDHPSYDEASPDATQAIPREALESALGRGWDDEPTADSPETTQVLSQEQVESALAGPAAEAEPETPSEHAVFPEVEFEEPADDDPDAYGAESSEPWRLEETSRTMRIDREAISDALGSADRSLEDVTADVDESVPDWEPSPEIEIAIARFNAVQRLIYRAARAEIGAGAANFIRSCCMSVGAGAAETVDGAALHADGSWDADDLLRAVRDRGLESPWDEYRRLIDAEIEQLRVHIGDARVNELERQVERVEQAAPSA